ncbi:hypothetical protein B0H17DRAFT_1196510 [Mycena rosella]|uniref:Uncharacterized protein n=1 Tax=Mycena rosella TaxID=1033263 RepID=A0AAD7DTQ6_MYCRO|nr:hypothetical protein B0H17DRAFT_1196510 [Mycena rosella]
MLWLDLALTGASERFAGEECRSQAHRVDVEQRRCKRLKRERVSADDSWTSQHTNPNEKPDQEASVASPTSPLRRTRTPPSHLPAASTDDEEVLVASCPKVPMARSPAFRAARDIDVAAAPRRPPRRHPSTVLLPPRRRPRRHIHPCYSDASPTVSPNSGSVIIYQGGIAPYIDPSVLPTKRKSEEPVRLNIKVFVGKPIALPITTKRAGEPGQPSRLGLEDDATCTAGARSSRCAPCLRSVYAVSDPFEIKPLSIGYPPASATTVDQGRLLAR